MEQIHVKLQKGHMVASGQSITDLRFPKGTLKLQQPFFKLHGLDFDVYFENNFVVGTLNFSVAPRIVRLKQFEYFYSNIKWTNLLPAENFFFSEAQVIYNEKFYKALLYVPDPSTKPDFFQNPSIIEVIAQKIPNIQYGDDAILMYNQEAIGFELCY